MHIIDHPAGLALEVGPLIPYLLEVFVRLFDDRGDGVCLADSIGREVSAVFWEDVRLRTDGAAVDMSVEHNDAAGYGEDGVWMQIGSHLPVADVCGCLYDVHEAGDMLHRGVHRAGSIFRCLFLHLLPGMDEEKANGQHKDRHSHEQDAQAELPG